MSKDVKTTRPDAPLLDAYLVMRDHRVRHVPVVEDGKLLGILSNRDLRSNLPEVRRLESGSASLAHALVSVRVSEVMTYPVVTTVPEASIREAASVMSREKVGALPVLSDGRLLGILSSDDILRALAQDDRDRMLDGW
jgi:acetoin utilization protein AcuB